MEFRQGQNWPEEVDTLDEQLQPEPSLLSVKLPLQHTAQVGFVSEPVILPPLNSVLRARPEKIIVSFQLLIIVYCRVFLNSFFVPTTES